MTSAGYWNAFFRVRALLPELVGWHKIKNTPNPPLRDWCVLYFFTSLLSALNKAITIKIITKENGSAATMIVF